jgi:hypothetical protein
LLLLLTLILFELSVLQQTGVIANARDPAHGAWLYNPKAPAGQRFRTLAATNINRYYHSTALLLPDASVLVMGSEYGEYVLYAFCTSRVTCNTRLKHMLLV